MTWFVLYFLIFLAALAAGALACGVARVVGLRLGLMDKPGGRKAHAKPIALTGGWGIFAAFMLCAGGGVLLGPAVGSLLAASQPDLAHYLGNIAGARAPILAVLAGVTIMFILGVVDDLRPLGPKLKLAVQFLATLPLLAGGVTISGFLPTPLGWALTIVWVLFLTNAFNLLDNMDGLSASVALVICLVLALAAAQAGQLWMPALFLTLAGVLAGFLCFNFHPAKLFMGDGGSLSMGYLVAVFSILVVYFEPGTPTGFPVLMPLAIMGVPLFDTLSVMFIRWRAGKPLMLGDRNHFSHRLLAMGFGVRGAALTIALLAGASGLLALPLRVLEAPQAVLHLLGLAMFFAVIVALEIVGRKRD